MNVQDLTDRLGRAREITHHLTTGMESVLLFRSPGRDRWSLAMVLDHLRLVDLSSAQVVARLAKRARQGDAGPPPEEVELRDLDPLVDTVMEYPVFKTAEPSIDPSETVLQDLTASREELKNAVEEVLTVNCVEPKLPHPALGPLNAYEWIAFLTVHELGHHQQMRSILEEIGEATQWGARLNLD